MILIHNICRVVTISSFQVKCKKLEEESSEANILFYKEELSRLKKSHAETERNLTLQIQTNERKAKDAFTQLRSKDTKLKETTELLRKLKKCEIPFSMLIFLFKSYLLI